MSNFDIRRNVTICMGIRKFDGCDIFFQESQNIDRIAGLTGLPLINNEKTSAGKTNLMFLSKMLQQ